MSKHQYQIEVSRRDIVVFALVVAAMLGSLVYGFLALKKDEPVNCWDQYQTENEAILHCEVHDQ
jgi:hypothetical protein